MKRTDLIETDKNLNYIDLSIHRACFVYKSNLVSVDQEMLDSNSMISVIKQLNHPEHFLKNYGFYFKNKCSFGDPNREIGDLWGWLKRLISLGDSEKIIFSILGNLKNYTF